MADLSTLFVSETEDEVFARFVTDMPAPPSGGTWETRTGSVLHALLTPGVQERLRLLDYARDVTSNCFLFWAEGVALDAKAAEFGLTRSAAQQAVGQVTFTGTEGTVVPIGTRVMTSGDSSTGVVGVSFLTTTLGTISLGVATVAIQAEEAGADGNVDVGAISILGTSIAGITAVSNSAATSGGADEEDDDTLRTRAVARAQAQPSGGNKGLYVAIGFEESEVATAYVEDLWNVLGPVQAAKSGVGSGRLILGGTQTPYVSPAAIDRLQSSIDPSVQILAHFEGTETWVQTQGVSGTANPETASPIEGAGSYRFTPATFGTTEITQTLATSLNLSRFADATDEVWLEFKQVSAAANLTKIRVTLEDATGANVAYVEASGTDIPGTSPGRIIKQRQNFTVVSGSLTTLLGQVGKIRVGVYASGSGSADVTVDGLRFARFSSGLGDGRANMGVQVTVRSARQSKFDISATVVLDAGVVLDAVKGQVTSDLTAYFTALRPGSVLRVTEVANIIHDAVGVVDYSAVQVGRTGLALGTTNIVLSADERPAIGTITLST